MKWKIFTFLACTILSIKIAGSAESRPVATLLIKNVTVISAHLNRAQEKRDVLILDDRILDILATGTDYPAQSIIDGRGKFLIPGLIDSHVHLGHNPLINRDDQQAYEKLQIEYRQQLPRSFLYHGFTSVIDLDYAPDRNGWLPGTELAPTVYHCGRGVRVAGGYGPVFVPPEFVHKAFPNLVYEARHSANWPKQLNPEHYSVDAAVQRVVQSGAICLKTYVESGFGGIFQWPNPSPEILRALSDAAHKQGLIVLVHATGAQDWQQAIAGGADIIAHGLWHWQGDRRNAELTPESLATIASAINAGVAVQPTMRVVGGEMSTLTWELRDDPRIADVLTPGVMGYLRSGKGRWSQRALMNLYQQHNPYTDTAPAALINVFVQRAAGSMLEFHRAGGSLLFGTDTPAQDGIGNLPGLNGYLEIQSWAEAGIPLASIFRAATLDNARAFKLDHELGSVEPGKQADLLLLNTNPLEEAKAYNDIAVVIVNGRAINRRELSAQKLGISVNLNH